jgi:ATP-binding cassette, subfamily C (CFTR/MRP), member 1
VSNLVLRSWGENNLSAGGTADSSYYIAWYGIDVLIATFASLLAGIFLWVYCAVRSARQLHDAVRPSHIQGNPLSEKSFI